MVQGRTRGLPRAASSAPGARERVAVESIALPTVLPGVLGRGRAGGELLALVKPQFEAGRQQVRRGGVVHDATVHASTVARVAAPRTTARNEFFPTPGDQAIAAISSMHGDVGFVEEHLE